MVIGITGLIGSGKSSAAQILKSFGGKIIDADRIGRQVVEKNPALLKKLVKQFGAEILTKSGRLNRKKLAGLAFKNNHSREKLDRIVHPFLLKELKRQLKEAKSKSELIVIDAALLLNWNLDRVVDKVILIHAAEKDRPARLAQRGIARKDALARQRQQLTYSQQRKRADFVVFNNKTESDLKEKLRKILSSL